MFTMTSFASYSNLISHQILKITHIPYRPKYCGLSYISIQGHMSILSGTLFISLLHCSATLSPWLADDHIQFSAETQFGLGSTPTLFIFFCMISQVREYMCITFHSIYHNVISNSFSVLHIIFVSSSFYLSKFRNVSGIPAV